MRRTLAVAGAFAVLGLLAAPAAVAASDVDRTLSDPRITESSGLATSALHADVLYTHNDSDDGPRVFAVRPNGSTQAVLTLRGAEARDWEGMSNGPDDTVWVGDVGDNIDGWGTYRVYRFAEPKKLVDRDVSWTQYDLRYADGESHNAESLLVHPVTGRVYVVTKEVMGNAIYAAPAKLSTTHANVLRRVAKALPYATDAAFSPDGTYYVVRGYIDAEIYATAEPGKRIATVDLPSQPQGESIAWSRDGRFLYAGSEGDDSKVYRVAVPDEVLGAAASPTPTPSTSASVGDDIVGPATGDVSDSSGGLPRAQVLWLAAGALVLIALGFSLRAWAKHDPDDA